jgi:hypothetical protein
LAEASVCLPFVFVGLVSACSDPYPIPATDCDDFCYATQRAECSEDYPEGCVSQCEREAVGRRYPKCQGLWHELTACYSAAPDDAFACVADESRPGDICLSERAALAECASLGGDLCVRNCFHQANECSTDPAECEAHCYAPSEGCQAEQIAYDTCALEAPVYCGTPEQDTRQPEDIPCFGEILSLLDCAGF